MKSYLWLVFALLGAMFAAIVNVLSKKALDVTDFAVALAIQCLLALVTLVVMVTLMGRWPKLAEAPRWAMGMMALSGVAAGFTWFFGYHALQLSKVAKTAPIDKLSMPLAVVLAVMFLREKPSLLNWFGIALMLAGAFCVAYTQAGASKG